MVNIPSSALSGSTLIADPMHTRQEKGIDTAHFALVFDPGLFRPPEDFRAEVRIFCDALRSTPAVDRPNRSWWPVTPSERPTRSA